MPQSAEKVIAHELLFREPEYQQSLAGKTANFEFNHTDAKVAEIRDWTRSPEFRHKNFAREALTVNPAKACQPLGAVYMANGFARTLSFVHGSQGCVAYYRSHFSRHFKEPTSCVSSSMTEDAAVFGGLNNRVDGLANAYNLYKPEITPSSRPARKRAACRPSSTCPTPTRRPSWAATSRAMTTRCRACCGTSGTARPAPHRHWSARPTTASTSSPALMDSWWAT